MPASAATTERLFPSASAPRISIRGRSADPGCHGPRAEADGMTGNLRHIAFGLLAALVCYSVASAQPKKKAAPRPATPPAATKASPALVVVNDEAITEADLTRAMQFRQVPEEQRDKSRRP